MLVPLGPSDGVLSDRIIGTCVKREKVDFDCRHLVPVRQ